MPSSPETTGSTKSSLVLVKGTMCVTIDGLSMGVTTYCTRSILIKRKLFLREGIISFTNTFIFSIDVDCETEGAIEDEAKLFCI